MADCKACGAWFESTTTQDLCPTCKRALMRLGNYVVPVVHGRWLPVHESEMTGWQPELVGYDPIGGYVCAVCKEEAVYDCNDNFVLSNYCPNCGAKMDGKDGDGNG